MKNNIKLYFLIIILFTTIVLGYLYQKSLFVYNDNSIKIKLFSKNNTWNTEKLENALFEKGDSISNTYLIKNIGDNSKKINLNELELFKDIAIDKISINGEKYNKEKYSIKPGEKININIEGIAKIDSNNIKQTEKIVLVEKTAKVKLVEKTTKVELVEKKEIKIIEKNVQNINLDIKLLSNFKLNPNINNLLEFSGIFGEISNITIGGNDFNPIKSQNPNNFFVNIKKKTLKSGKYLIEIVNSKGIIKIIDGSIIVEKIKNDNIFITSITPNKINLQKGGLIVLQGYGFKKIISIQLNNNIVLKNTSFNIINDNVLSITIPKEIKIGTYHFNVMDTDSIYEMKDKTINIISN